MEVGSGYSTAKMLDTADEYLPELNITCIEPYPARLLGLLGPGDVIDLIDAPVQSVPMGVFTTLESGDILFIDSTHVAKAGSDVVWPSRGSCLGWPAACWCTFTTSSGRSSTRPLDPRGPGLE